MLHQFAPKRLNCALLFGIVIGSLAFAQLAGAAAVGTDCQPLSSTIKASQSFQGYKCPANSGLGCRCTAQKCISTTTKKTIYTNVSCEPIIN
jgi:hypothetical protein